MDNKIIEQQLRYELARKKIVIEKKCLLDSDTMTWSLNWYGKNYRANSLVEILNQLPLIKGYKKDISELSGLDENDTVAKYNQMIVDNNLRYGDRV